MKVRSTVFWPEHEPPVAANEVLELGDDEAKARIAAGLAVEHVEPDQAEPAGGAHVPTEAEKAAAETAKS